MPTEIAIKDPDIRDVIFQQIPESQAFFYSQREGGANEDSAFLAWRQAALGGRAPWEEFGSPGNNPKTWGGIGPMVGQASWAAGGGGKGEAELQAAQAASETSGKTISYELGQQEMAATQKSLGGKPYSEMTPGEQEIYNQQRREPATPPAQAAAVAILKPSELEIYKEVRGQGQTFGESMAAVKEVVDIPVGDKTIKVPRSSLREYDTLTGKAQFDKALELGFIPEKSQYIPEGDSWTYISQADALKAALNPTAYKILTTQGFDAYNKAIGAERFVSQQDLKQFERVNTQLPGGQWISNANLAVVKQTDPEGYAILTTKGFDAYDQYYNTASQQYDTTIANQEKALKVLEPYKVGTDSYNIAEYWDKNKLASEKTKETILKTAGFDDKTIRELKIQAPSPIRAVSDYAKAEQELNRTIDQVWRENPKLSNQQRESLIKATPEYDAFINSKAVVEEKIKIPKPKEVATVAAEMFIPGVRETRPGWKNLPVWQKTLDIAIDIASVVPLVSAGARGARMVSATGKAPTLARLGGAAKGIGREALAQLAAPVNIVLHPIGTAKAGAREIANLVENIADPRKIPEASLTNIYHTLKLRVKDTTSAEEAIAMRDEAVRVLSQSKDKRVFIKLGDQVLEVERSPFARETGGLAHGTPFGEKLEGKVIKVGEEGMYLSPTPAPRFSEATSLGAVGEKHAFIIVSPETAKKIDASGKLYRNTAELEGVLPKGTEFPIKQKLYTRIGVGGQYTELWLEKPLSLSQIAKLKAEGLIELAKQPFTPAIKIKGRQGETGIGLVDEADYRELADELRRAGNPEQARLLLQSRAYADANRTAPPRLERITGRVNRTELARERARIELTREIARVGTVEREGRIERVAKPERITRVARADQAARVERVARTERIERIARLERATRPERITRPERVIRTERIPRIERPGQPPRTPRIPVTPTRPPRIPRTGRLPDRPPRIPTKERKGNGKERKLTSAEIKSAVVWKQGYGWWVVLKDGRNFFTPKLPEGATVTTPSNRPIKTIQSPKGKIGFATTADLGKTDLRIAFPGGGRKGKIVFSPDPKRLTKMAIQLGRSQRGGQVGGTGLSSIKRGSLYHTKVNDGTLLSRRSLSNKRKQQNNQ